MYLPIPVRNKLRSTPYKQGLFHIPPTAVVGSDTRNFFLPLKISQSVPWLVLSKNSISINWKAYYEGFLNLRWPKWSKRSWKMRSLGRNWFYFLLNTLSSKLYLILCHKSQEELCEIDFSRRLMDDERTLMISKLPSLPQRLPNLKTKIKLNLKWDLVKSQYSSKQTVLKLKILRLVLRSADSIDDCCTKFVITFLFKVG